jgi:riboflavin kinase/FMN adenylyltransferase
MSSDMKVFRGFHHPDLAPACALTIGNFDGVHRGHQAMLALLRSEAAHRGVPSCVMTFEPHPRDYFAKALNKPELAPARIATLRDKLQELERCGVDQVVVVPFDARLASQSPQDFIEQVLVRGLVGRPYSISGHVVHGRKLGRELAATAEGAGDGFRTLNLRFSHWKPAASGIFVVEVHGLADQPLKGVANLGIRPSLDPNDVNGGRVLLETHAFDWPAQLGAEGGYGKIIRVDLLHKLHDELKYDGLDALTKGIAKDCDDAQAWFASRHGETSRQTTRDRI